MEALSLKDFNYSENSFKGPYGDTIIDNKYVYEKSGHKFSIYTLANGKTWMGDVYKNGKSRGSLRNANTPRKVLEELNLYIRKGIVK